jgi:chloramphenicol-sensitive protein RarD
VEASRPESRPGLAYGLAAYGLWGLMPLYFAAVAGVRPLELLAHRVAWSALLLAAVLTAGRRWGRVRDCLASPRTRALLLASSVCIACNWYLFIWGVERHEVVQNSLGFFINPLLNVVLGVALFRERLRPAAWLALALACAGLVYLVVEQGRWPWIAFGLAGSFALYGLIRKVAPVDGLIGLTVETLFLLPAALAFLAWWQAQPAASFGRIDAQLDLLLVASGAVTATPLMLFGEAARRLRLSTLAFIQYLAPSFQLLLAVTVLGEPFGQARLVSFALIWLALLLVSVDSVLLRRRRPPSAAALPASSGAAVRTAESG